MRCAFFGPLAIFDVARSGKPSGCSAWSRWWTTPWSAWKGAGRSLGASELEMRFLATKGDSPHRVIQHGRRGKAVPHNCIISVHHNINIHIHINIHIYILYIYINISRCLSISTSGRWKHIGRLLSPCGPGGSWRRLPMAWGSQAHGLALWLECAGNVWQWPFLQRGRHFNIFQPEAFPV